jgi:hypothetical protein
MAQRGRGILISSACLLLAVLVGVVLWLARSDRGGASLPHQVEAPSPLPRKEAVAAVSPDRPVQAEREVREAEPAPSEPEPKPGPELAIVRGRCVAAEGGVPLAGCKVTFEGYPSNSDVMAKHGPVEWTDPEPQTTVADGRFEFAFVPPPPYQHHLEITCRDRVSRTARWGAFEPGEVEDLGDVALAFGYMVEGRVVDESGAPVPNASVSFVNLPLPIRDGMAAASSRHARSGEDGTFRVAEAIPAGTWSLDVRIKGFKLLSPDSVTVHEPASADPVTVVVKRMPAVSGVVVDETGAPVPRVTLQAEFMKGSGRTASGRTQEDGSFTIHAVDDDLRPVRLIVTDPGPCEKPTEPGPEYAWGTNDIRIELRRALSFELTVVERVTGTPVEDFAVVCHLVDSQGSLERNARLGGHHPQGQVTVDRVRRGSNRLEVKPRDAAFAPSEPIEFEADRAPLPPIRVELDRLEPREVLVSFSDGSPAAGSRVELIRKGSEALDASSIVVDPRRGGMAFGSTPGFRAHEVVADATTGEKGSARILVKPGSTGLGVRVTGPSHVPLLAEVAFPPGNEPLRLVVRAGGKLVGKLRVEGYAPGQVWLQIEPTTSGRSFRTDLQFALGADGAFESPSLEPGEYQLVAALDHHYRREGSSSGTRLRFQPFLTSVLVEGDETQRLELDGTALAAATVEGQILVGGAPFSEGRVYLRWLGQDARFGQYVPDEAGRFTAEALPPGRYVAGVVVGDYKATEGDPIESDEEFELAPGQRLARAFHLERRRLRLRILQPNGAALAQANVRFTNGMRLFNHRTDDEGWIHLDPSPAGTLHISYEGLTSGPVEVPRGQPSAELEVVLKEP